MVGGLVDDYVFSTKESKGIVHWKNFVGYWHVVY